MKRDDLFKVMDLLHEMKLNSEIEAYWLVNQILLWYINDPAVQRKYDFILKGIKEK